MRRYIIPILLLPIASLFAAAQTPRNGTLHKDIEVEQQTAPTRRDAARISVLPEVTLPALAKKQLLFSDRVVTAPVPNVASSLAPVAWTDPEAFTSQRGYVVAGVFPLLFNADLSAGYRIIDNNRTRLSAWLQYDGDIYRRDGHTWRSHQLDLGANLHQAIGRKSMLDAAVSYTWGRANQWQMQGIDDMSRTVCIGALDAAFSSKAAALDYKASFKVERAGFSHLKWDEIFAGPNTVTSPLHQTLFNIGGEAALPTGDNSNFGIGLTLDILNTASHNKPMIPFVGETLKAQSGKTSALLSVSPRWALHSSAATLSVGATMDVAFKAGSVFSFNPDVTLAWTPAQIFGIELKATGGSSLNSISSLYSGVTRWLNPTMAYERSHVPYDFQGRITFGPLVNTSIELFGGYARANDWLMPVDWHLMSPGGALFESLDVKGYRFGAAIGYDDGRLLCAKVRWTTAPSGQYKAFYEWRDRARNVIEADVRVRPFKKLSINAGFEMRNGRAMYAYGDSPELTNGLYIYPPKRVSLGTVANLRLGASYECSRSLAFFAEAENILSRYWREIGPRPTQGVTALVGASYKF